MNNILKSLSNNIVAIWAMPDAGLNNGKMYVSSLNSFNVVNLATDIVDDYYTEVYAGKSGEVLQGNDIIDINIL